MHGDAARAVGIRNAVQKKAETSRTGRPPLSAFTLSLSAAYIGGKGECNVNVYLFSAVVLLLPALCTALGAAGVCHPADALRHGGGHHAGRQCVEPAPARHRAGRGRAAAGLAGPGSGACAGRCGLAATGRSRRAADARRREGAWPDGPGRAGCDPPQPAGGDGGGPCGGAGAAGRAGGRQRGTGPCAGHRPAEHPGGRGGEPAAGTGRAGEAESLLRRGCVGPRGAAGG